MLHGGSGLGAPFPRAMGIPRASLSDTWAQRHPYGKHLKAKIYHIRAPVQIGSMWPGIFGGSLDFRPGLL